MQHGVESRRRPRRLLLSNGPTHGVKARSQELLGIEGSFAGQQFIEQHAQRVNIAPGVDVQAVHFRLLRTHVGRRANELFRGGEDGRIGQTALGCFGDAEIDHLRRWQTVVQRHQNIRRLEVAVDDTFLVRMLDGTTNLDEQFEPLASGKMVLVAVVGDLYPAHQVHHEERPARLSGTRIQHLGDIRMVHQGQRLPLGLEASDDLSRIHPQLDDLEGDAAFDRFALLGHIHHAKAAFTDLFQQLVAANQCARLFLDRQWGLERGWVSSLPSGRHHRFQVGELHPKQASGTKPLRRVGGEIGPALFTCAGLVDHGEFVADKGSSLRDRIVRSWLISVSPVEWIFADPMKPPAQ